MKATKRIWFYTFALLGATVMLFSSCEKEDEKNVPTVTTTEVIEITHLSAVSGGNITSDGGATVTARGVCWSTSYNPTISDSKTEDGNGMGIFTSSLSGLEPNTTYYVRAYATNSVGTAYGGSMSFTTLEEVVGVEDADGNYYTVVTIGNQTWMKENLKTTKYNDGSSIPYVTDSNIWVSLSTPAYCWYDNDNANKPTYGALYNWYAVNTGKLCPTGWHVPTDAEWTKLTDFLGGEDNAGGKLKETGFTHWTSPNEGATNETFFTALPCGLRDSDGGFHYIGSYGWWWSAIETNTTWALARRLAYNSRHVERGSTIKGLGVSVRCLRN